MRLLIYKYEFPENMVVHACDLSSRTHRQEELKFKISLGYIVRHCLKSKQNQASKQTKKHTRNTETNSCATFRSQSPPLDLA